ncbi:hypothetical protein GCM10028796_16980 [Ramlibacter monticola]|uniref:Uncharacterized protein n=1 Tax=Ramlibacter monticola TaxID=1926872 RepID=A0A937CQT3_9BURK|nr:hypothetical protein [Ramlibacter monticola]MBL0390525.1 hypothetical protein [Ramlibacter monticola]
MASGALFVEPLVIATGGALTSTNVDGSLDPAAYDAGHAYGLGDQATSGESVYQSLQAANTGHAVSDAAWWVRVGAINKMRMFDQKVGAQTERADTIVVEVTPAQVIGVVSLRNVQATSVTVEQRTVADGVIFTRTISLDDPVSDWFEYFFNPITRQSEVVFTGMLPFGDAIYKITVDNTGGTAKCGEVLMGPALEAGITEGGVTTGIDDYSRISADEFGVRDIVERDFADNMEFTVYVPVVRSPTLVRFLTQNRARPILVLASDARPDAQVFGLAESWRRTLSYPGTDVFNVSMKGLT